MQKNLCLLLFLFSFSCTDSKIKTRNPNAEREIRTVLDKQVIAWNEGNIDAFMQSYWQSDSLQFIGSDITKGWNSTLEGYKRRYPTAEALGSLRFEILEVVYISPDAYLVTGKYFLTRTIGDLNGIFTLLFRNKEGKWVIVYDHTS